MRVAALSGLMLGLVACGPQLATGGHGRRVSTCSTSKTGAVPYFVAAAAGVAATGALWPQLERSSEMASDDGCVACKYQLMIHTAPAILGVAALGLGVHKLGEADRCARSVSAR